LLASVYLFFNMFSLLFLAATGVRAAFYDHEQIPLRTPSQSDVVVPLTVRTVCTPWLKATYLQITQLDQNLHYTFPSPDKNGDVALQDVGAYGRTAMGSMNTIIIDMPLDSKKQASITFSYNASTKLDGTSWLPSASHIELDNVGIRKGGMITMPATSALLQLGTPYISLPDGLFYILLQAADTSAEKKFVVDCESFSILPDLIFGLAADEDEDEDEDFETEEIVVAPQQYVMEGENGKCMLLARSAGEGPIEMGWAAIRGRKFVMDLARGRMGFGSEL
jgi:hypothetical protein